jgi:LytS/YehU family sensor histidine kinase
MILISLILGNLTPEYDLSIISLTGNLFGYTLIYLLWSLIYFMFHYVESYNKSLRYEAYISEIRLNKLKSQMNPHFIFNGLNSIRALVDEDPQKSKVAITQLSNILRNSLVMDKQRLINFNDEIKTVKDYLDLESIRFEERLETEIRLDPESGQFQIPPMMIQTLVENAIKHGISDLVDGGKIQITSEVRDGMLNIRIRNSGQYVNGVIRKTEGFGIRNTVQRLKLIYADRAEFKIGNENENTVLTEIKIPRII